MHSPKNIALLLFLAGLLTSSSRSQSLSIRFETNKVLVQAVAPANIAFRLQASTDLETWADVSDPASGTFLLSIDPSKGQFSFFRMRTWATDDAPIKVIMVGDSTMADFASNQEQFSGWGQGMHDEFKPNVTFVNFATPVQSSESFLTSIQRQNLEVIKPEFVIIQFGMVDQYPLDIATTLPEFEANLKTIVQIVRDFGGTPILVTPVAARLFDDAGRVRPWLPDRCEVVQRVSNELQTYFIDLNERVADLFDELGPVNSEYISWPGDAAHFSLAGAEVISELFVDALPQILASQVVASP